MRYRTLTVVAVVAVVVVALVACTDAQDPTIGDGPPAATEAPDAAETDPATTAADTTETEAATEEAVERIEVTVSDGEVDGPGTVSLEVGTPVELVVTSDVADEIHVHGYDLHQDVGAGETATVTFTADIPGVFEVELEENQVQLVELQVRG